MSLEGIYQHLVYSHRGDGYYSTFEEWCSSDAINVDRQNEEGYIEHLLSLHGYNHNYLGPPNRAHTHSWLRDR